MTSRRRCGDGVRGGVCGGSQRRSWEEVAESMAQMQRLLFATSRRLSGGGDGRTTKFGDLGSLEQHGFARNRMWSLDRDPSPLPPPLDNHSSVDLILNNHFCNRKVVFGNCIWRKIGNHLEQREKLGLTSTTKGQSKSRAAPSESTNALEKVEVIGSAEHDKASVS
ncbi:hypothetical protein LR48_Vigan03g114000 [Vigna angularis]|uniref:Uncharacterized protein n=1 Tax=Phaseolus angularis TaxID=3914 RepID=A0A0L9U4K9_PHAAN|nr:hypothetical protein LR48_Vigan03g114000 [Vigna angularis]